MKNKFIIIFFILLVCLLLVCFYFKFRSNIETDSTIEPIIYELHNNGTYSYIVYEGKEYIPYCDASEEDKGEFIGQIR